MICTMKRLNIIDGFSREEVDETVRALNGGGVVLMPTDTLYALMVDAGNPDAMEKLFVIKGRAREHAVQTIVADIAMAEKYTDMSESAKLVAERFLSGPLLTLVVPKKEAVSNAVLSGNNLIGLRIPANDFCLAVVRKFGRPITATSANVSGVAPERMVDAICAQLGERASDISLAIDSGELPVRQPTTVVEMLQDMPPRIIREGVLSVNDILNAIK